MNGKGDKRRPLTVSKEQFAANWDRLFNRRSDMIKDYDRFVEEKWMGGSGQADLAIATLGLVGEAGEVAEKIKKHLRGDPAHNPMEHDDIKARNEEIIKELGDVAFYISWLAVYHGSSLEGVLYENQRKLNKRLADNGTLRGDGDNR
jgi:NTP pyrophosphatase (non-canonical NTP hydrolase)